MEHITSQKFAEYKNKLGGNNAGEIYARFCQD